MSASTAHSLPEVSNSDEYRAFIQLARRSNRLLLEIAPPASDNRGQLSGHIKQEIERQLVAFGAPPLGACKPSTERDLLSDQIYRARLLGYSGLAIALHRLSARASGGQLDTIDASTLRWWHSAAAGERITIHTEAEDHKRLLGTPRLVSPPERSIPSPDSSPAPESGPQPVECGVASELTTTCHDDEATPRTASPLAETAPAARTDTVSLRSALKSALLGDDDALDLEDLSMQEGLSDDAALDLEPLEPQVVQPEASAKTPLEPSGLREVSDASIADASTASAIEREHAKPRANAPTATPTAEEEVDGPAQAVLHLDLDPHLEQQEEGPFDESSLKPLVRETHPSADHQLDAAEPTEGAKQVQEPMAQKTETKARAQPTPAEPSQIRRWREALAHANGQQTFADLEALYLTNYLPLQHALIEGAAGPRAKDALRIWASNFAESYQSAFEVLKSRGRRPGMVLDAPQLAFQWAREHDVKNLTLVLVDGMRLDVGQRSHDKLKLQLTGLARCVSRDVLWAALPSTTATQLELLARGAAGLKDFGTLIESTKLVAQGADARKLRGLRAGPHQLRKLDVVESVRAHAGSWKKDTLDQAAAEVAVSVGRYIRQQPPGAMIVMFGDHGFALDGESPDASPERVLVPIDAWLRTPEDG